MIYEIGEFLGVTIIILYVLTVLNYVVKLINKKFRTVLKKNETVFKIFGFLMKIIVKNHRLFGIGTVVALLAHFAVQFSWYGVKITGAIAAFIMILQVGLGIYGFKTQKRGGLWLLTHRLISVALLIAILIHI